MFKLFNSKNKNINTINISENFRLYVREQMKNTKVDLDADDFFIDVRNQILKNIFENKITKIDLSGYSRYLQTLDKRFWLYLLKDIPQEDLENILVCHESLYSVKIVFEKAREKAINTYLEGTNK